MKKTSYIYEIHLLRALACLMILMIHVTATIYYMNGENHTTFTLIFNQITRVGTCLFAMISGFLLFYHSKYKAFDMKHFLFSRTTKVLFPFLFWTVFYLFLKFQVEPTHPIQWNRDFFYELFVLGDGFYHLWFISVLIQFYILFPLLQYLIKSTRDWNIALVVSLSIQLYFLVNRQVISTPDWDKAYLFNWIFYFILAGFIAHHWERIRDWAQKHVTTLVFLSIIVLGEALWSLQTAGSLPDIRLANLFSTPILMLTIISLYPKIKNFSQANSGLNLIGAHSMGIYLVHPFLLYFSFYMPAIFWEPSMILLTFLFYLVMSILLLIGIQQIPYNQYLVPSSGTKKNS